MANQLLRLPAKVKPSRLPMIQQAVGVHGSRAGIGNRDVVGYGVNGEASYADRLMFPFPAIRFKENTPDVLALREKEKGDWKKLSIEDKKALYRASFCQTYAEMRAPTGEWKSVIGVGLGLVGLSWWMYIWMKLYVYPPLPKSFELENRQAQLQRMIDLRVDQITGLTSEYDYENNKWKK